jgi:hypothetical protein
MFIKLLSLIILGSIFTLEGALVVDLNQTDKHLIQFSYGNETEHDNIADSTHSHTHKHSENGEEHEHNHDHNSTTQLNLKLCSKHSFLFIDSSKDEGIIKFPFKSMTLSEYQLSIYRPPIS